MAGSRLSAATNWMLIYLDLNCFNRPFDDQGQARIARETAAVFTILERIVAGTDKLAWSDALAFENSQHPLVDRAVEIASWAARAEVHVRVDERVAVLARELLGVALSPLDAAHLACAEAAGCAVFLTCDDRLQQRSRRARLKLHVLTPVEYLERHGHE